MPKRQALITSFFKKKRPKKKRAAETGAPPAREEWTMEAKQQSAPVTERVPNSHKGFSELIEEIGASDVRSQHQSHKKEVGGGTAKDLQKILKDIGVSDEKAIAVKRSEKKQSTKQSKNKPDTNKKLTKMEQMWMQWKKENPEMILFIENGYKYTLYGQDAEIASRVLKIWLGKGHNLRRASIPIQRLYVQAKRLVDENYVVGVVRQVEKAAIREFNGRGSGIFERKITEVYTKSTFDVESLEESTMLNTSYLLAVSEEADAHRENVETCVLAVDIRTGDVFFNRFRDSTPQTLLQLLSQLQPDEVLVGPVREETRVILKSLGSRCRVADGHISSTSPAADEGSFYPKYSQVLSNYKNETMGSQINLVNLYKHLEYCKIGTVFGKIFTKPLREYQSIETGCKLDAGAIIDLKLLDEQGPSLFSLLNKTKTSLGRRLLKRWIRSPLKTPESIKKRLESVESLLEPRNSTAELFRLRIYDFDKGVSKIKRLVISPRDLVMMLESISAISRYEGLISGILGRSTRKLFEEFDELYKRLNSTLNFEEIIKPQNDEFWVQNVYNYANISNEPQYQNYVSHLKNFLACETSMQSLLAEARERAEAPQLKYVTISDEPYLFEIPQSDKRLVKYARDRGWVLVSSTKKNLRYRPQDINQNLGALRYHYAKLEEEFWKTWKDEQVNLLERVGIVSDIGRSVAEVDVFQSFAKVSIEMGYTKPKILSDEEEPSLRIIDGRHPLIEQLSTFIPNTIEYTGEETIKVISGPNMSGKSTLSRQVGLIAIMAQIGCFVPAEAAEIHPFDGIYVRAGSRDDIIEGRSTFMTEMEEMATILKNCTRRSLVLVDELGRGTDTFNGSAISYGVVKHLLKIGSLCIFSTHNHFLIKDLIKFKPRVSFGFMDYFQDEDKNLVLLYKLTDGVCPASFGINVARTVGIDESIVRKAEAIAEKYDAFTSLKLKRDIEKYLSATLSPKEIEFFREIMESVDTTSSVSKDISRFYAKLGSLIIFQ